jgi:uncharacterized protein YqeY
MAILDQIQADVKDAMRAKDSGRVQALRMFVADLQRAEKEGNDDELGVLRSARKKRVESAKAFRDAGRDEQAAQEEGEIELIDAYLPAQMSDERLAEIVKETVEQTGASDMSDMGKVMGAVMGKVKGEADGNRVQALVKEQLAS